MFQKEKEKMFRYITSSGRRFYQRNAMNGIKRQKETPESMTCLLLNFSKNKSIYKKCAALGIHSNIVDKSLSSFIESAHLDLDFNDLIDRFNNNQDIDRTLLSSFINHINQTAPKKSNSTLASLVAGCDMRQPIFYHKDKSRAPRKLIMHVGPTNSGKTYNALQALKASNNGIYCGPLRLLAHEIFERFNNENVPCNLVTGEDVRRTDGVNLYATTMEMVILNQRFNVAVIDEIQMISDPSRGWAWTQALLGINN